MRLEHTHLTERFGAVRIHELQRVIELDSGGSGEHQPTAHGRTSEIVSADAIRAVERELVVVIPCKNETRRVIEGVLSGIPHDCLIVLISNSGRTPMVRISWHSKPKLQEGRLFFSRRGRASQVTNHFLNQLIAEYSGFGTEVIATGNAGEHALTIDLARRMRIAGGRERV